MMDQPQGQHFFKSIFNKNNTTPETAQASVATETSLPKDSSPAPHTPSRENEQNIVQAPQAITQAPQATAQAPQATAQTPQATAQAPQTVTPKVLEPIKPDAKKEDPKSPTSANNNSSNKGQMPLGMAKKPNQNRGGINYKELKKKLHTKLVAEVDTTKLGDDLQNKEVKTQITSLIEALLQEEGLPMPTHERKALTEELIDDILGLGPLESLLRDNTVNDILVNGPKRVYVERKGVLEKT